MYLEFCPGGTLKNLLQKHSLMGPDQQAVLGAAIARSMSQALGHMHMHGFAHMDVAARNVLLVSHVELGSLSAAQDAARLSDFGMMAKFGTVTPIISVPWSPAESNLDPKRPATAAHDAWSFGCLIIECLSGFAPWNKLELESNFKDAKEWTDAIVSTQRAQPDAIPPKPDNASWHKGAEAVWGVAQACLRPDPATRDFSEARLRMKTTMWKAMKPIHAKYSNESKKETRTFRIPAPASF